MTDCLDETRTLGSDGCNAIPTLILSSSAKQQWVNYFNHIEHSLKPNKPWSAIKDVASKAAENVVRLAALFHVFDRSEGDIDTHHIEQACTVMDWHLHETHRLMRQDESGSTAIQDAQVLLKWLQDKNIHCTSRRYCQQYSPLRQKQRRDEAINMLIAHHYLRTTETGTNDLLVSPHSRYWV